MGLFRQITKSILTTCIPSDWLMTRGEATTHGQPPRIALTFDDGPHPEHTARLLDALDKHDLKATFYVIGSQAERQPQLIHRMAEAGHELGNHTWSHGEPSRTSSQVFLDEVRRTDELLVRLTGVKPRTVRPPKGEMNWSKLSGLWRQRKTVALWNVDPRDYRMTGEQDARAWCERYVARDRDILLMHDNHPWAVLAIETLADKGVFEQVQTVTMSNWSERGIDAPHSPILANAQHT